MAQFLDGKIELIELNDTTWRNKVNANFTTLTAAQELDATGSNVTYTIDATPPTNSTYDHTIFAKLGGSYTCTVTLPTPTMGRVLFFLITASASSGNGLILTPNSGGKINDLSVDASAIIASTISRGVWIVSNGTQWFALADVDT